MVSGISFGGLASGLDTEDMIEQLMALERAPMRQLEAGRDSQDLKRELWQAIHLQLASFDQTLRSLRQRDTFTARQVQSAEASVVRATATGRSDLGSHDVVVDQLAQAHRVVSDRVNSAQDPLGLQGRFWIPGRETDTEIEVQAGDSLSDIRDAINGAEGKVYASIVDQRLVLTGTTTGVSQMLSLREDAGGVLTQLGIVGGSEAAINHPTDTMGALVAAVEGITYQVKALPVASIEAEYRFGLQNEAGEWVALSADGSSYAILEAPVSDLETLRDSLSFADTFSWDNSPPMGWVTATFDVDQIRLEGLHYRQELHSAQSAHFRVDGISIIREGNEGIADVLRGVTLDLQGVGSSTLSVTQDSDRALTAVKEWVDTYNRVQGILKENVARHGLLQGDGTAVRLQSLLRTGATDRMTLTGPFQMISQVGITVDRDGNMGLDESVFRAAFREDPDGVAALFQGTAEQNGDDGMARRVSDALQDYVRYGTGILVRRDRMFEDMSKGMNARLESMERLMERREHNLRRQFTQLERMLSELNSQGQWLDGQIDMLSSMRGQSR